VAKLSPSKATPSKVAPSSKALPSKAPPKAIAKKLPERKEEKKEEEEVTYSHVEVALFVGDKRLLPANVLANPLDSDAAKALLGWTVPDEKGNFVDFDFTDMNGVTVKCTRLNHQRPFKRPKAIRYAHEILDRQFEFNGEPILLGNKAAVLDGQHRLIALEFAKQLWEADKVKYWKWETPPTIDVVLIAGIPEEIKRINTINTGTSRTMADAFYAANLFPNSNKKVKKNICKAAGHAISMLWFRTGANVNAFSTKRTHAESLDFLERHPRLATYLETTFNWAEECGKELPLSPGYSAALLYLMASTATENIKDGEGYHETVLPTEERLDFSYEEVALDYWKSLFFRKQSVQPVLDVLNDLVLDGRPIEEKLAAIILGWRSWLSNEAAEVLAEEVDLESNVGYSVNGEGVKKLSKAVFIGGIDTAGT